MTAYENAPAKTHEVVVLAADRSSTEAVASYSDDRHRGASDPEEDAGVLNDKIGLSYGHSKSDIIVLEASETF